MDRRRIQVQVVPLIEDKTRAKVKTQSFVCVLDNASCIDWKFKRTNLKT